MAIWRLRLADIRWVQRASIRTLPVCAPHDDEQSAGSSRPGGLSFRAAHRSADCVDNHEVGLTRDHSTALSEPARVWLPFRGSRSSGPTLRTSSTMPAPPSQTRRPDLDRLLKASGGDGAVDIPDRAWSWAFALGHHETINGCLVVSATDRPAPHHVLLLSILAQREPCWRAPICTSATRAWRTG
jgi:hypothetical protein